jgi:hypothetical protein
MKKLKQLSFFGLALAFILSSCSIEKRKYMPGYAISWNHHSNKQKIAEDKTETSQQAEAEKDVIDDNTTASLDNPIILPSSKPISFIHKVTKEINKQTAVKPSPSNFIKNHILKSKKNDVLDDQRGGEGDNKNLAIVGLVLGILGCVGYYAGPLFGLAAIIVSAIALNKIKKNPSEYGGKGMAIGGLILGIVAVVVWILVIAFIVSLAVV